MPTNQVILGRPMNRRDEQGEIEGIKLFIVGEDGTRNFVFVRPFGNDNTGDGTLSNPYLTLPRGLEDAPVILPYGQRWFVDVTGMGVINLPDDYAFPLYETGDTQSFINFAAEFPSFFFEGNVNLRAVPTVLDTITPAEVVSIVSDPTTGLITLTTTKVWVLNQWQGRHFVSDSPFDAAVVASNTVNALVLTAGFLGGSTFQIVQPSAELRNPNPISGTAAVAFRNSSASVVLQGIKISHANPVTPDVEIAGMQAFAALLCEWKGFLSGLSAGIVNFIALSVLSKVFDLGGASQTNIFNSYFESAAFQPRIGTLQSIGNIYQSCTGFGHSSSLGSRFEDLAFFCASDHHIGPLGNGITYVGGQYCAIDSCKIDSAIGGDGILGNGPGRLRVTSSAGTGNAFFGLNAKAGCQVQVGAGNSITGVGGDVKVGAQAVMTWAAIVAAISTFDEGLALSEGSRVFV